MKQKLVAVMLAGVVLLGLASCSDDDPAEGTPTATVTVTQAPVPGELAEACDAWSAVPVEPSRDDMDAYADAIVGLPTEQRRVFLAYAGLLYQEDVLTGVDLLNARAIARLAAAALEGICSDEAS